MNRREMLRHLLGLGAGVTMVGWTKSLEGVWHPGDAVTVVQALEPSVVTMNAQYAEMLPMVRELFRETVVAEMTTEVHDLLYLAKLRSEDPCPVTTPEPRTLGPTTVGLWDEEPHDHVMVAVERPVEVDVRDRFGPRAL